MKKWTLWLLEYTAQGGVGELVPIYAEDEKDAHERAARWVIERNIPAGETRVTHFPHGFTIHHSTLPGEILTNDEEC
jgi:hypothetical protein